MPAILCVFAPPVPAIVPPVERVVVPWPIAPAAKQCKKRTLKRLMRLPINQAAGVAEAKWLKERCARCGGCDLAPRRLI